MKTILVLLHDDGGQEARLQVALDLSRALDGHLICLDVTQLPIMASGETVFDSGQAQVDAIRGGLMAGAVTQDPIRLGYKTVEAAVDVLNGRRVPRRIDTGFHWYDRTNLDDPAGSSRG